MKFLQQNVTAVAILFGFALVAAAIYTSGAPFIASQAGVVSGEQATGQPNNTPSPVREDNRRVYGDIEAETTIVEFSDLECPFCARLHPTLKRVVDESGGSINWEYRHFPLPSHRGADMAARIGECVADELGDDAFWTYLDAVFADIGAGVPTYEAIAIELGIETDDLDVCTARPAIADRIQNDLAVGRALGGSGTPFSVIQFPDGSIRPVSGALPYQQWQRAIQQ